MEGFPVEMERLRSGQQDSGYERHHFCGGCQRNSEEIRVFRGEPERGEAELQPDREVCHGALRQLRSGPDATGKIN